MKKVETGGMKSEELLKRMQMNEPKIGKVGRSARFGQVLAITCFDDITGKELPWRTVKEVREKRAQVSA